jgi:CubicO group peptidase (beta-lactamase class C family)
MDKSLLFLFFRKESAFFFEKKKQKTFSTLVVPFVAAVALLLAPPARAEDTAGGTHFTLPRAWALSTDAWGVTLTPPEAANFIKIVDVPHAAAARDAVAQAWKLAQPGFARTLKVATTQPARDGWDEAWEYDYETSPNERLVLFAAPQRAGTHWSVTLVSVAEPVFEKRLAAVDLALQSIQPRGYQRETFAGHTAHVLDAPRVAALQDFLRTAMQQMGIPGIGLALTDRGHVVYEGGLGVRALNKPAPVDAHTLFMIASNTKGMTTLLLSELVDQHKLRWDEPVTEAYTAFRLGNADTTRKVLIKHLVCACTGLPRQDMEWLLNSSAATPAAQTFTTLSTMQPTSAFGESFQYSNLMASAAGYIGAHIVYPGRELGAAYDAAMQTMIFDPLAMHDTTFDFSRALAGDYASPHAYDVDGHIAVARMDPNYSVYSARPAGGAWSSAHDMILYVQDELSEGRLPSGQQLVSAQNLLARRAPGVSVGQDATYGMGLMNDTHEGVRVVHHGGSLFGYKSDIIAIPAAGVGAVILTNSDTAGRLLHPFRRRLLEILYDGKPQAAADVAALAASEKAERAAERKRLAIPADPTLAATLAARYTNAALGHIDVKHAGSATLFDFGAWHSGVASRKNDDGSVSFVTVDPAVTGVDLVVRKKALVLRDGQHEYVYDPQ